MVKKKDMENLLAMVEEYNELLKHDKDTDELEFDVTNMQKRHILHGAIVDQCATFTNTDIVEASVINAECSARADVAIARNGGSYHCKAGRVKIACNVLNGIIIDIVQKRLLEMPKDERYEFLEELLDEMIDLLHINVENKLWFINEFKTDEENNKEELEELLADVDRVLNKRKNEVKV